MKIMHRNAFYALAVLIVALDQVVKALTRANLVVGQSFPLWPGVFHLTHTQNRGMAFSLLEGKTSILAFAAILVVIGIIYAQIRIGKHLPRLLGWALALALGGALGNLTDRLRLGYVTDLFDARIINFPVFNVADTAITFGIILLAWRTLTEPQQESTLTPGPSPASGRGESLLPPPSYPLAGEGGRGGEGTRTGGEG